MTQPPGATVLVQEVWSERVWAARPMTVVCDAGDSVAFWFPKGTRWQAPSTPPRRPREPTRGERLATCASLGDWIFTEREWPTSTLVLMREGEWHAIWVSWLDDDKHWGWYVNLQEPYRRTRCGFETMDLMHQRAVAAMASGSALARSGALGGVGSSMLVTRSERRSLDSELALPDAKGARRVAFAGGNRAQRGRARAVITRCR